MAKGEVGATNVPKKAIQAMDIIYQSSTLMGTIGSTIPTQEIDETTFKFDVTKGVVGEYDVAIDAKIEPSKLTYTQLTKNIAWSRYTYAILDGSKLTSRVPRQAWKDSVTSASEHFATIKDYQCMTAISAGAASSHTATANWDTDTAEIENDIVKAIQYIVANSNVQPTDTMSVIYPADVAYELMKLDLIGNVQQQLKGYLEKSFKIDLRPFRPFIDEDGTAQYDALSDDCLVYVNGNRTCRHAQYSRAAASRNDIPLVENWREHGRGEYYLQKMGSASRVVWDGINATDTISGRIYKILDVT